MCLRRFPSVDGTHKRSAEEGNNGHQAWSHRKAAQGSIGARRCGRAMLGKEAPEPGSERHQCLSSAPGAETLMTRLGTKQRPRRRCESRAQTARPAHPGCGKRPRARPGAPRNKECGRGRARAGAQSQPHGRAGARAGALDRCSVRASARVIVIALQHLLVVAGMRWLAKHWPCPLIPGSVRNRCQTIGSLGSTEILGAGNLGAGRRVW